MSVTFFHSQENQPFSLRQLIDEVINMTYNVMASREALYVFLDPAIPDELVGDVTRYAESCRYYRSARSPLIQIACYLCSPLLAPLSAFNQDPSNSDQLPLKLPEALQKLTHLHPRQAHITGRFKPSSSHCTDVCVSWVELL